MPGAKFYTSSINSHDAFAESTFLEKCHTWVVWGKCCKLGAIWFCFVNATDLQLLKLACDQDPCWVVGGSTTAWPIATHYDHQFVIDLKHCWWMIIRESNCCCGCAAWQWGWALHGCRFLEEGWVSTSERDRSATVVDVSGDDNYTSGYVLDN